MTDNRNTAGAVKLDGGTIVAKALQAAGVRKIFSLHGGHLDPAFKGFSDHDIALVDTRHEASAGHAAEAWARLTGEIGVCMVTAGGGFTNVLTSMMNARHDGTPVLYMAGSPPLREEDLNVLQGGVDMVGMALHAAKYAIRVTQTDRIADTLARAITIACNGRPGPVFVELPLDVLACTARLPAPIPHPVAPEPVQPAPAQLDRMLAALQAAQRPVIVLGGLARYQAVPAQITNLVERTGMPVVATSRAMGLIACDHPAYAHEPASIAMAMADGQAPDLILMLGARYGMFLAGRTRAFFPEGAKIIQVHADAAEFGRVHQPDLASTASIGAFADAIAGAWQQPAERLHGWRDALVAASQRIGSEFTTPVSSGGINPYHAAQAVVEAAPDGTTFVIEGGEAGLWGAYHARVAHPGGICTYGQMGILGTGMGFALGAAHARPGHPVIQITGDGAIGFHLQEFEPMVRQGLPVVTVVLNNNAWGMSIHGQQVLYGANYSAISLLGDVRYHDIARGFGCYGERVTELAEIGPAIARALRSGLPACIDVTVDLDVVAPGTLAMLGDGAENEIMIPYYENIPLD